MSEHSTGDSAVGAFVAALASSAPTPGGGAASALAGALAAALGEMVGNLTAGRKRFAAVEAHVRDLLARLTAQRVHLLRLIAEDTAAYQAVAVAYGLPRATDEQRAARTDAVETALRGAMTPPADIGGAALAVLRLTAELANVGNPTVASDAGCAALLAEAAVRCASLNVLANVVLLRDAAVGAAARAAAQARDEEATEVCRQVLAVVYARMGA